MDKALDYGSENCGFESHHDHLAMFLISWLQLTKTLANWNFKVSAEFFKNFDLKVGHFFDILGCVA